MWQVAILLDRVAVRVKWDYMWDYMWKLLGWTVFNVATIFLSFLPTENIPTPRWASSPHYRLFGWSLGRESTQNQAKRTQLFVTVHVASIMRKPVSATSSPSWMYAPWCCGCAIPSINRWSLFLHLLNLGLAMELALANETLENMTQVEIWKMLAHEALFLLTARNLQTPCQWG